MREDKSYCNCCVNRDTDKCKDCYKQNSKGWYKHTEFRPTAEFSRYFHYFGNDEYMWNSTGREVPHVTKSVVIHNKHYCPYCANPMFPIQDPNSLTVMGYTCFCDGAIAETEYDLEKLQLLEKHENELTQLRNKYRPRLTADLHTLFDIKQEEDRRSFEFFHDEPRCLGFGESKSLELEELI